MRTEQLLRQTLDDLADTAPHPTRISLERPARRRPTRTLLLAALAVVAVLAVLVPLVVTRTTAAPADRRAPGYWRMISGIEVPTGWRITLRAVVEDHETIGLARDDASCQLTTYGRGRLPADQRSGGEAVTVAGRPGTWVATVTPQPSRLVWTYDDDAYAVVGCDGDVTEAGHLALAEAARFDQISDLRLPFRLTDLPAGDRVRTVAELSGPDGLDGGLQVAGADGAPGFDVGVRSTAFDAPGPGLPGVEQLTVGGHPATVREDQRAVQLSVAGRYPTVSSHGDGTTTQSWLPGERDRMVQVAGDLRFAPDLADPDTWFTADRAVP